MDENGTGLSQPFNYTIYVVQLAHRLPVLETGHVQLRGKGRPVIAGEPAAHLHDGVIAKTVAVVRILITCDYLVNSFFTISSTE